MSYVCKTLAVRSDMHGEYACQEWVELDSQSPLLDSLAITPAQAGDISLAVCSVLLIGWLFGLLGGFLLKLSE